MESLRKLWPYIKPHRKNIVVTMGCMLMSGLLQGGLVYLIGKVLEPMLSPQAPNRMERLNYFSLIVAAIGLTRVFFAFGQTYLSQRTGQRILAQVRLDLFAHLQRLPVGFFERKRTGELMSRLTNDLGALQSVLTQAVGTSIQAPVGIVIMVGLMLKTNWQLSVFLVLVVPLLALMVNRAGRRIKAATGSLQRQLAELTNYLQEKIAAMRLIQTFGTREYEVALFNSVNQEAYRRTMKPIRISASLAPTVEFLGLFGVLACLWFGARGITTTEQAAGLFTFLIALNQVVGNAKALAGLNLTLKSADAAADRLWEIFDTVPEVRDRPGAIDLKTRAVSGHLKFEDVRFAYSGGPEVLHGISFEVKPGQAVALAGLSGSGKSTVAALVPRLYDPASGRVTVDGLDLRDVQMDSLRAHIGAVPQETTLFHGTIRDNIAYARPNATLEQVAEAARRAYADEFIRALPEGYDTHIGERGSRLSGGQRQRIAIARALLRDPRILILDEATSALDAESEREVQLALEALMAGRTTLIIAHRFSTIQRADNILVLDAGHIMETGTHEELLKAKGRYWSLYQMQSFRGRSEDGDPEAQNERAAPPSAARLLTVG